MSPPPLASRLPSRSAGVRRRLGHGVPARSAPLPTASPSSHRSEPSQCTSGRCPLPRLRAALPPLASSCCERLLADRNFPCRKGGLGHDVALSWRCYAKDQSFNGGSLSHRNRCTVSPGPTPRLRISSLSSSVVAGCHKKKTRPAGIAPSNRDSRASRPLLITRPPK